jgi:ABC-type sugar transport system permease subunit
VLTFALVLTGGGPGSATRGVSLQLYRLGFESYRFGQANALAMLMMAFNVVLILVLVRLFRQRGSA